MNRQPFYISAASTISHQATFRNPGFSAGLAALADDSVLQVPDFKSYIEPGLLRRMSKILRISVACAKDCIEQAGIEQPDAIIVGTGLGCLQDTEKFLNTALTVEGLLPPTSFIQSTHNTMAGQISLSLGNHGYNMTHTQNTLSFEHALLDAAMLLEEGEEHILVGAADEYIELLDETRRELGLPFQNPLTSAASFFLLSRQQTDKSLAILRDTEALGLVSDLPELIADFLKKNEVNAGGLDLVLVPNGEHKFSDILTTDAYLPYSGIYPTASAFAVHYAVDRIVHEKGVRNVLVCNSLREQYVGLTLIQALEA